MTRTGTQTAAPQAPPSGETITVRAPDGTLPHVRAHGPESAPAIVFLHGYGVDGLIRHRQTAALSATQRLLTVDLRGHGRSGAPLDNSYQDLGR
jgi:pimeloyl-ACP methyl ester carboxylesterase